MEGLTELGPPDFWSLAFGFTSVLAQQTHLVQIGFCPQVGEVRSVWGGNMRFN